MKNLVSALAAVVCLFIAQVAALAQESEAARQAVEFCETRYAGTDSSARLKQIICIQDQNIKILEARIKKGETGLETALAELRKKTEATQAKLEPAPAPASTPVSTPAPAFVGTPYSVMPTPGQYAASTFDVEGPRLRLEWLADGVNQHLWSANPTEVRIVVKKNGAVISVAHPDSLRPWNQFYADLNGDGRPDSHPYNGVDPLQVNEVYISHVAPSDRVELIYLTPTGTLVNVPGMPPELLFGNPVRVQHDRVGGLGRLRMNARNGTVL